MADERTIQDALTKIKNREVTAIELKNVLDGDGGPDFQKLVIETKRQAPERQETPPRRHTFNAVAGFIDYVQTYGGNNTAVYADVGQSEIIAVLDEKAVHGVELLSLKPAIHPRWKPWRDLINKSVKLSDFVLFLRTNRKAITEPSGEEVLVLFSQVRANTQIELHQGRGNGAQNGVLIKSKVIGGAAGENVVDIPDKIRVHSPIYVAGEPRDVDLDVLVEASSDGLGVTVRVSSADILEAEINAFEDVVEDLDALKESPGAVVAYGRPDYGMWAYHS